MFAYYEWGVGKVVNLRLKAKVLERYYLGNGFKVAIVVNQKQIIFQSSLSNAAIDWAANGKPLTAQVTVNTGSRLPRINRGFNIILCFEVGGEESPFLLVQATLKQFKLSESGE
ncbi:hypothetical protein ANSO36C_20820 [Nostoc cf. commune SO-36]|uniref:Uncharacterized protein n=1 Tax=Nostoc cf. commune SO-36 TaxID=449208 RepID=A0ABM7YZZ5_NOSCO|nr:hypothetical protein ANSO36C_20820 [Nostoc cf. commune SO-36]